MTVTANTPTRSDDDCSEDDDGDGSVDVSVGGRRAGAAVETVLGIGIFTFHIDFHAVNFFTHGSRGFLLTPAPHCFSCFLQEFYIKWMGWHRNTSSWESDDHLPESLQVNSVHACAGLCHAFLCVLVFFRFRLAREYSRTFAHSLLVAGCWLLAAGRWLLVAGCWLLVAGCW